MASPITSPVSSIEFLDNIGVQLNYSGSPTGYFQVQVSIDYNQDLNGKVTNAGNWVAISFAGQGTNVPVILGSPIYLDVNQISAPWIRIFYSGGGTGNLNAWVSGKVC